MSLSTDMSFDEEHELREKTRSMRGDTRDTLTRTEQQLNEAVAMVGPGSPCPLRPGGGEGM